jgi:Ser/Thr protein kinase RdoA (MazF antagonist)
MSLEPVPTAVREAYGLADARVEPTATGWINRTFIVATDDKTRIVLQKLHPIFRGDVNLDIEALTRVLHERGIPTPLLVRTRDGRPFVEADGVWRAITYLDGRTVSALDPAHARAAASLVGRFHHALSDVRHTFAFTRPGAHDTPAHLAKLARLRAEHPGRPGIDAIAARILDRGAALPDLTHLPIRIIHGDLKATNILFHHGRPEALALVDLDTLAHGTLAVELGDALRSWCNPTDESDPDARFDAARFEAAVQGYAETAADLLAPEEIEALVPGVETIALELASRFAADVYEDRYFGWDATRFASRVEHNLARTRAQLSLADSIATQRDALRELVQRAFR